MINSTSFTITISFIFIGFREGVESTVMNDKMSLVEIQNVEGSDGIDNSKDKKKFVRKRVLDRSNKGISEEAKIDIRALESFDSDSSWLVEFDITPYFCN